MPMPDLDLKDIVMRQNRQNSSFTELPCSGGSRKSVRDISNACAMLNILPAGENTDTRNTVLVGFL